MFSNKIYDLIVIGAGSGGLECAWNATELYKVRHVAIIDQSMHHGPPFYSAIGGTCVNVGCVPKKLLVVGSTYKQHLIDCKGFGYDLPEVRPSWKKMIENKNNAVHKINESYKGMFNDRLEFHLGFARFISKNKVEILNDKNEIVETLESKIIVVDTGSWPSMPALPGIKHTISSNEAFYLDDIPPRVLVVGGGFIAVEFASIFNGYKPLDGQVTIAYRGELFLRGFDNMIREEVANQMRANGVNVIFKENPAKIELNSDGSKKVTFDSGKVEEYDLVMYATGRKPKTEKLQLDKIGVELTKSGGIKVDKGNKTNVSGIYAIGDVIDKIMLTPVAINEGSCLASTLFSNEPKYPDYENIASAVFAIPFAGTCGLTENEAVKKFSNLNVYETSFLPLMHQLTGQSHKRCHFKLITNADNSKLVGAHLVSMDAPEIIQIIGVVMKMGGTITDFNNTIGVHPTSAEDLMSMRTPDHIYRDHERVKENKN